MRVRKEKNLQANICDELHYVESVKASWIIYKSRGDDGGGVVPYMLK